jgi:hypothetical protein
VSLIENVAQRIAIDVNGDTVKIELSCTDAYGAQVLADDLSDRLIKDHVLALIVKVAPIAADRG